jgi:hypothetical protein
MGITDDVDVESLVERLAAPLPPVQREAFRQAAQQALEQIPCLGEGVAYRALSVLWRTYFDPPVGEQGARDSTGLRPGKLANKPPIGRPWVRARRAG